MTREIHSVETDLTGWKPIRGLIGIAKDAPSDSSGEHYLDDDLHE